MTMPERASRRASDADREAVVEALRAATEDGRLDFEEFEQRMGLAYQSKTFGELEPLLADLAPVAFPSDTEPRTQARALPPSEQQELNLSATGTSIQRRGRWRVPPRVNISGNMGSTWLDLTEAEIESAEVEFHLETSMGSLTIVVPPGTEVDGDQLNFAFGSLNVRTRDQGEPTRLRIRLIGQCTMGSVHVRGPGFFARRRLRRASSG